MDNKPQQEQQRRPSSLQKLHQHQMQELPIERAMELLSYNHKFHKVSEGNKQT